MKGLTLTQPWATLVASGAKTIETRSWTTRYRGPLAIHAAAGMPIAARRLCITEPFASALRAAGYGGLALLDPYSALPRGVIVAVCNLNDVVQMGGPELMPGWALTDNELAFGDWAPGRYAWALEDVEPVPEPLPCKGSLGLWNVPPSVFA